MPENTLGQSVCGIFYFWLVWLVNLNTRSPLLHCTCFHSIWHMSYMLRYLNLFMLLNSKSPFNKISSKSLVCHLQIGFSKVHTWTIHSPWLSIFCISLVMGCLDNFTCAFFIIQVVLKHLNCRLWLRSHNLNKFNLKIQRIWIPL